VSLVPCLLPWQAGAITDPSLHHFAIFSDNILALAVAVNSTVSSALEPQGLVFHVITDAVTFSAVKVSSVTCFCTVLYSIGQYCTVLLDDFPCPTPEGLPPCTPSAPPLQTWFSLHHPKRASLGELPWLTLDNQGCTPLAPQPPLCLAPLCCADVVRPAPPGRASLEVVRLEDFPWLTPENVVVSPADPGPRAASILLRNKHQRTVLYSIVLLYSADVHSLVTPTQYSTAQCSST